MPKNSLKNKKKWFKRKAYGFGWYPASREGWVILLLYTIILVLNAFRLDKGNLTSTQIMWSILPATIIMTIVLIVICYQTGESPIWQWGPYTTMPAKKKPTPTLKKKRK